MTILPSLITLGMFIVLIAGGVIVSTNLRPHRAPNLEHLMSSHRWSPVSGGEENIYEEMYYRQSGASDETMGNYVRKSVLAILGVALAVLALLIILLAH